MKNTINIKGLMLLFLLMAIQVNAQWEYMEPMPTPRAMITANDFNGKIYVIGGLNVDNGPALSTVEMYDPVTDSWDTTLADIPVPICGATSIVKNGKIIVMGGRDGYPGNPLKSVFSYDPVTDTWEEKNDMTSSRSWFSSSILDEEIYVVGGFGFVTDPGALNILESYNYVADSWTTHDDMPYPRAFPASETLAGKLYVMGGMHQGVHRSTVQVFDPSIGWTIDGDLPGNKAGHGSAVINDTIYVFGGNTIAGSASPGIWKYHPSMGWSDLNNDMPEETTQFAYTMAHDDKYRKCIYTFGGATSDFTQVTGTVLKFTPKQKNTQWEYMEPIPTPRVMCTASEFNGKVYVIGGIDSEIGPALSTVEVYDPVSNSWDTTLADFPVTICGASSNVVNGNLYVIGGRGSYQGSPLKSVFVYNPITDTWENNSDMTSPRSWHATSAFGNSIYSIGGYGFWGELAMDSFARFDYTTDTWETLPSMPTPRAFLTSEVSDNAIFAMGGLYLEIPRSTVEVYIDFYGWMETEDMPRSKFGHGSTVIDDTIYVFGGNTLGGSSPGTWMFHPSVGWSDLNNEMPEEITQFAYTVAKDENNRKCIYTFGGISSDHTQVTEAVLKYCPKQVVSTNDPGKTLIELSQIHIYPNPFSSKSTINYELENSNKVCIKVYNIAGQEMKTLFDGYQLSGTHEIEWDATGLTDGLYLFRLQTDRYIATKKCILQRF